MKKAEDAEVLIPRGYSGVPERELLALEEGWAVSVLTTLQGLSQDTGFCFAGVTEPAGSQRWARTATATTRTGPVSDNCWGSWVLCRGTALPAVGLSLGWAAATLSHGGKWKLFK